MQPTTPSSPPPRTTRVSMLLGTRGTGKSYYVLNTIIPQYMSKHPERLVLIVDTIDHPMYRDIPLLKVKDFKTVTQGLYRTFATDKIDLLLTAIFGQLKNALIIFEDATKFVGSKITPQTRSFILNSKQRSVDVIYLFHGFVSAPLDIWRIVDSVTFFKCDGPEKRKNDIINYDEFLEKWKQVMASPDKYARQHVKIY